MTRIPDFADIAFKEVAVGDHAAPGWWMSGAAACGLFATFLLYRGIAKER